MGAGVSRWSNRKLNLKVFPSRKDFIEAGQDASRHNKANIDGSGYDSELKQNRLTNMIDEKLYENQTELKEGMDYFEELTADIDMGGAFKKSRLKITDDKRGIFDFGIASKGLYNPKEYFSSELAKDAPDEFKNTHYNDKLSGIVPPDLVKNVYVLDKKQFWYTSIHTAKKYLLTPQNEGTRAIELNEPDAKEVFRTTVKKSYVMFEKKGGKAKMVELYLPLHANIDLVHAIPLFLIAKFLQLYGIATRISTIRMYHEGSAGKFIMWGYPIKDYGEEMDFNFMALNGVDDRWWHSVRVVVKSMNDKDIIEKFKANYGRKPTLNDIHTYNGGGSDAGDRSDYIEVFSRYRNWYMEQIKLGLLPPLRVDKKLMMIGGSFGSSGSISGNKAKIKKEFFRILDTVDFQFNKPETTCQRIYKRLVTDVLDEYYQVLAKDTNNSPGQIVKEMRSRRISLTADYKTYVQDVLIGTYTYPRGGEYPESKESAVEMDEALDDKFEKLTQFLQSV